MVISKKIILYIVIIIWIVFSLVYIFYDLWSDFKLKKLNQAYQQGSTDTINTLIKQAKNCNPIPIYSGDTQIEVINVDCVKSPTPEEK